MIDPKYLVIPLDQRGKTLREVRNEGEKIR